MSKVVKTGLHVQKSVQGSDRLMMWSLVSQPLGSLSFWKYKQVTGKPGLFRIPAAPSPDILGPNPMAPGSRGLDHQGWLWMFLLDNITPSHLPAAAQGHLYRVCPDSIPVPWELNWDNFLKEGAYKSKLTHADALSQETMILILDSHPERPIFSKRGVSFESFLWISVLSIFLGALTFPSLVLCKDSDWWQPPLFFSFLWSAGDWKCKSSDLHSHMSLCISIIPSPWNCSNVVGATSTQQNLLTGLVDIFNCLRASL